MPINGELIEMAIGCGYHVKLCTLESPAGLANGVIPPKRWLAAECTAGRWGGGGLGKNTRAPHSTMDAQVSTRTWQ